MKLRYQLASAVLSASASTQALAQAGTQPGETAQPSSEDDAQVGATYLQPRTYGVSLGYNF